MFFTNFELHQLIRFRLSELLEKLELKKLELYFWARVLEKLKEIKKSHDSYTYSQQDVEDHDDADY